MADVGGVGRDFPLSMEKPSPILAFYVVDGVEQGRRAAVKCWAMVAWATLPACIRGRVRQYRVGAELPASRITINTPDNARRD